MCEVMSSAARLETWFFQVNQELGEIGGVFVSKQPSDTDMGAKEPKTDGVGFPYMRLSPFLKERVVERER